MCLAVPGRIEEFSEGNTARVDFGGIERAVAMDLLPDAKVGDYVLVHAGFAIQRLEASEAHEVLSWLEQIREAGES